MLPARYDDNDDDDNFPKGIGPNMNIIVRLQFKLAYYKTLVQYVSHYATRIFPGNRECQLENAYDYNALLIYLQGSLKNYKFLIPRIEP